jgi:4-hydroxybenzoate polyprenyltransferase
MIKEIIITIRPKQWSKNFVIFAALLFSENLFNLPLLLKSTVAFVDFCLLSGGLYIINDLIDIKKDRYHPIKSMRPLASGTLKQRQALIISAFMIISALFLAVSLNQQYLNVVITFLIINLAYSFFIKNIVILDVMVIAIGFVLRAVAGGEAISVMISGWLLICTLLLALFLGFCKRLAELNRRGAGIKNTRRVLEHYSSDLLHQIISVAAAGTIAAYAIYTMSEETISKFNTTNLKFTLPFVIYGIMRYMYILHKKEARGEVPENVLLFDKMILLNILLYTVAVVIIIYT